MASFEDMFPEYRSGGKSAGLGAVAEVLEVAGTGLVLGAVEQRYGEEKTTLFMTDQVDSAGNPVKDANGKVQKVSGTGVPMSAAGAVLGLAATVFVPRLSMNTRKHILNVSTGLATAWSYRKGIEMGQKWLDSAQPAGTPKQAKPLPPFGQNPAAVAELANVQGEELNNISSLNQEAERILRQRAANG
jgi:hypothetical protein